MGMNGRLRRLRLQQRRERKPVVVGFARRGIDGQLRFQPEKVGLGNIAFDQRVDELVAFLGIHTLASASPSFFWMQSSSALRSRCSVTFKPPTLCPVLSE